MSAVTAFGFSQILCIATLSGGFVAVSDERSGLLNIYACDGRLVSYRPIPAGSIPEVFGMIFEGGTLLYVTGENLARAPLTFTSTGVNIEDDETVAPLQNRDPEEGEDPQWVIFMVKGFAKAAGSVYIGDSDGCRVVVHDATTLEAINSFPLRFASDPVDCSRLLVDIEATEDESEQPGPGRLFVAMAYVKADDEGRSEHADKVVHVLSLDGTPLHHFSLRESFLSFDCLSCAHGLIFVGGTRRTAPPYGTLDPEEPVVAIVVCTIEGVLLQTLRLSSSHPNVNLTTMCISANQLVVALDCDDQNVAWHASHPQHPHCEGLLALNLMGTGTVDDCEWTHKAHVPF